MMQTLLFFAVSFLASVVGAICGIGGGVVIKPTLDIFHLAGVPTISFLSSCTVLSMSCYSVVKGMLAHDSQVNLKTGTPLAIGAAVGGVLGQNLFTAVKKMFENANRVGAVQAACLFLITLGTFVYTLKKNRVKTLNIRSAAASLVIGLMLGLMSSFLGIGGGPINLVVLSYFFSMSTKPAAQNSLYVILFSQLSSMMTTLMTGNVPEFELMTLVLMVAGGIGGGMLGRMLNRRMDNQAVDKLFLTLMVVIMFISMSNAWRYALG